MAVPDHAFNANRDFAKSSIQGTNPSVGRTNPGFREELNPGYEQRSARPDGTFATGITSAARGSTGSKRIYIDMSLEIAVLVVFRLSRDSF
jgi:hypothetical protein